MQKNELTSPTKVWEGKIDDVHVVIIRSSKVRDPRINPYNETIVQGKIFSIVPSYPVFYKRPYFQVRTPRDTYVLPPSVKTLKQAKHWVRSGLDKNPVIQHKKHTTKPH